MNKHRILTLLALSGAALISTLPAAEEAAAPMPSSEEMWRVLQQQQQQIEALTAMVEANQTNATETRLELAKAKAAASNAQAEASSTRQSLASTQAQLEATTLAVEEGGSAFGSAGWWEKTSIGGYGELHANFFDDTSENEIDFHRFVLFFNHEFNDWITLYSELEIEHADTTQDGAVELEQAYLRMDWTDYFSTDVGLFLMPIGIINETHEPNTFYGVERNRVENRIIPTTWREAGIKANYRFGNGIALDAGIVSGLNLDDSTLVRDTNGDTILDASSGNAFRIRSSREDASEAPASEAAYVARAKFTGIAGLELAGSIYYQDDLAQEGVDEFSGLLTSAHAVYTYEGFTFKALYAQWDLDGDTVPNDAETQYGWYLEPSYRWNFSEHYGDLGVFIRYSDYEYYRDGQRDNKVATFGVNWWPTNNVVFKADFQSYDNGADDNGDDNNHSFNLGVGYQF